MGLFKGTKEQYHGFNSFTATANQTNFTLDYPTLPSSSAEFNVFLTGTVGSVTKTQRTLASAFSVAITSYTASTGVLVLDTQIPVNTIVEVILISPNLGNYKHISLDDITNNFIVAYTGEDKLINRARRTDVVFYAKRAFQELSYDTLKSTKAQEVEIDSSLQMDLPPDYVNYVNISWVDNSGIYRPLSPIRHTGNPTDISQDGTYEYIFNNQGEYLTGSDSTTLSRRKNLSGTVTDDINYDTKIYDSNFGRRFGINPDSANANGYYFIDEEKGKINFSSNVNSKLVVVQYVSDGLATDGEMVIHKFAEEAVYKYIAHGILATKANVQEYIVNRFKKEKRAAIRTAKLRLSNLKPRELEQTMRGKSKQIKH
tara:strand:- start:11354 stop:12466 length:1113 start_codon:yes stop_codon:yes gene_type:complete